tara:strand:- start:101 stop:715 length:615 start_codon:yes stop_codon:yes gene_type:complete
MKNKNFSSLYLYLFFLLSLIILIYIQGIKSKNINENFIISNIPNGNIQTNNNKNVVNLSCDVDEENQYNCKRFTPEKIIKEKTIVKQENLLFETGIGPTSNTGKINFKKTFSKPPTVYCTAIVNEYKPSINMGNSNEEDKSKIPSVNVNIFNVTTTGFEYVKTKMSTQKQYNGMLLLEKDNEYKFNWLALTEPISKEEIIKKYG